MRVLGPAPEPESPSTSGERIWGRRHSCEWEKERALDKHEWGAGQGLPKEIKARSCQKAGEVAQTLRALAAPPGGCGSAPSTH